MSEVERLRALLAEARREHDGDANIGACGTDNDGGDTRCDRCKRIDAALAEPVEGPLNAISRLQQQLHEAKSNADWLVQQAQRERDEARAEVERLSRLIARCVEGFEAVRRSNHARAHAAADEMLAQIRDLPVPEDKP